MLICPSDLGVQSIWTTQLQKSHCYQFAVLYCTVKRHLLCLCVSLQWQCPALLHMLICSDVVCFFQKKKSWGGEFPIESSGKFRILFFCSVYFCKVTICMDLMAHSKPHLKKSTAWEVGVYPQPHECWVFNCSGALYFPLTEEVEQAWKCLINFFKSGLIIWCLFAFMLFCILFWKENL